MPERDAVRNAFRDAAIEWAAGGRGQPLVDAAAEALAAGLDSPALRVLAGVSRRFADDEAAELAPAVFDELGLDIEQRLSPRAIVAGARSRARQYLAGGEDGRSFARALYAMYVASGYSDELEAGSGLDDWYDMIEDGVIEGRVEGVDAATREAAKALVEHRPPAPAPLEQPFPGGSTGTLPLRRRLIGWLLRGP